ncbi:NAD-dependent epimerase/dehydratase family protein [Ideonella sp. DXS29W]|uniref:NAD-dependent epimerase/dehydratase family protein n=1 Tax=Ideonella lacteola TaxID=2984193 RepID=A0ABU9BS99_9BURK
MRILLTGASGFIGRHLASMLSGAGHTVIGAARRRPSPDVADACQAWHDIDFATVESPEAWLPWLADVDVVINAVGIVSEEPGSAGFERLHHRTSALLFEACQRAGVKRVIHLSALGADASATSRYHLSKRAGDEALLVRRAQGLDGVVLQPSLVFGLGGASTQLFLQWATWPRLLVPEGAGPVQPVHVDDLSACVLQLVERTGGGEASDPVIPVVGPEPLAWEEYLQRLRAAMGLPRAPVWRVPLACVDVAVSLGERLHSRLVTREIWAMLQRGNTAPMARPSRPCRPAERFLSVDEQAAARLMARLPPALALLRFSLALVWIVTAIVSFGLFPVADSLGRVHTTQPRANGLSRDAGQGARRRPGWCLGKVGNAAMRPGRPVPEGLPPEPAARGVAKPGRGRTPASFCALRSTGSGGNASGLRSVNTP